MTVVAVPYVAGMMAPEAAASVWCQAPGAELVELDPAGDGHYATVLESLWARGEQLVIVEHDVVPPPRSLTRLAICEHDWCGHDYADPRYPTCPMLGLARFSARLVRSTPEVAVSVLRDDVRHRDPRPWWTLDQVLARHLVTRGWRWHRHYPDAVHLHGVPAAPG